jgi:rhodanese-related sulfurtransferase
MKKDSMLMEKYRDKTIVFYCSHSQRSRRVSKLLTERGFTNFYNLNGGMSNINQLSSNAFPCKNSWIEFNLPYRNIDFIDATTLMKSEKGLFIIDVRPASEFNSTDSSISKNIGRIKGAVNIPYSEFKQRMGELPMDKSRPILLYSSSGDGDGARAALLLTGDGYTKIYQLLGGLDDFEASQGNSMIENGLPFRLLDSKGSLALLKANPSLTIYDTRSMLEFENKVTGMESYKNLGRVKNSVHLNEADFATVSLPSNKKAEILIFGRGEAFRLANTLIGRGYKNVYLHEGLYDFVWSAFNVAECKDNLNYLENHTGLY